VEELEGGLQPVSVDAPLVTRTDPCDVVRRHAVLEHEEHGVHAGLASADHHRAITGKQPWFSESIRWDARDLGCDVVERGSDRRDDHVHVGGVHRLAGRHVGALTGDERAERPIALVVTEREVLDSTGGHEVLAEDLIEVADDLRTRGELGESLVPAVLVDVVRAEHA